MLFAIISGSAAWLVQEWRYDAEISTLHAQYAKSLADAKQAAIEETEKLQRTKDAAIQAAQERAQREAANAARARSERDSLRKQLASASVQLPNASCTSVREYAATVNELFDQCAGAFADMAETADRHASDAMMLLEAWPK
jgi:chromosome segregation ATPase